MLWVSGLNGCQPVMARCVMMADCFELPRLKVRWLMHSRIDIAGSCMVSAGPGIVNQEFVEILHSVEYVASRSPPCSIRRKAENIRIINVRGDSMSGTIEPGDLLFVDINVKSFDGDGIYAFLYDDTAHVKRLQKMKDKLLVISDNKAMHEAWGPDRERIDEDCSCSVR